MKRGNGKINFLEQVNEIKVAGKNAAEIITSKRKMTGFDFVVSAVPLYALEKFFPGLSSINNLDLNYSSILSIHIWLKENKLKEDFFGID